MQMLFNTILFGRIESGYLVYSMWKFSCAWSASFFAITKDRMMKISRCNNNEENERNRDQCIVNEINLQNSKEIINTWKKAKRATFSPISTSFESDRHRQCCRQSLMFLFFHSCWKWLLLLWLLLIEDVLLSWVFFFFSASYSFKSKHKISSCKFWTKWGNYRSRAQAIFGKWWLLTLRILSIQSKSMECNLNLTNAAKIYFSFFCLLIS